MFDASKLEVGKKYRTRDHGPAEFIRKLETNEGRELLWIGKYTSGNEHSFETDTDGVFDKRQGETCFDIISSDPIKEPVEVTLRERFVNVYLFDDGTAHFGDRCSTPEEARGKSGTHRSIGVAELPATLKVIPR